MTVPPVRFGTQTAGRWNSPAAYAGDSHGHGQADQGGGFGGGDACSVAFDTLRECRQGKRAPALVRAACGGMERGASGGQRPHGAMIFGGLEEERIQFNEATLWRGKSHDYVREGAGAHLHTMQQLIFDDDVERLLARGGFEVDMEWRNGALARAVIRSKLGLPVRIRCGEREALLKTTAGQNYALDGRREFVQ